MNKDFEAVWEACNAVPGPETSRQYSLLEARIDTAERKRRHRNVFFSAVAVAASLVAVATVTFTLTRNKYAVSPLDGTRTLVAEYGQLSSITLEDGTQVHLNAGSTLLYPEKFGEKSREVWLSGEGNFTVAKDPARPFIVKTTYMDVKALGTVFGIHSFPGERSVSATLKEGKIQVDIPTAAGEPYILNPDMQLVYSPKDRSVSLMRVNAGRIMDWQDGGLSFTDATCPEIFRALERRYGVTVSYSAAEVQHHVLNLRFMPGESLEDALNILTLLIPGSRYEREGDRVYWHF